MKAILLLLLFLAPQVAFTAGETRIKGGIITPGSVAVGTSGAASTKAVLDMVSTTKGYLPPRMTTTQRDAISSVPTGLTLYNTTLSHPSFYDGSNWQSLCGITQTCTMTGKTISGSSNTLSNIADGSLSTSYLKADGSRELTGSWTVGPFTIVGPSGFVGPVTGNASTATALAANPSDCGAGTKAISIDASGGLTCSAASLTADVSGILPIANGGTNASVAATGFNNLAPTTTKGDLIVSNGSSNVRLGAGADNTFLKYDSSTASGLVAASVTLNYAVTAITGTSTLTNANDVVTASSGPYTITLFTAVGNTGKVLDIKKTDSTAGIITIDGNASETIDGVTTFRLGSQYDSVKIISDGSNWHIISKKRLVIFTGTTSGGTITNATDVPVAWTEVLDTDEMNASGSTITINTAGKYLITASLFSASGTVTSADAFSIKIVKGGSTLMDRHFTAMPTTGYKDARYTGILTFAAAETFTITARQDSGNDITLHTSGNAVSVMKID